MAPLRVAEARLIAGDVVTRHWNYSLKFGHLNLENHHALLAKGHFRRRKIELPHTTKLLVVETSCFHAACEEPNAPSLKPRMMGPGLKLCALRKDGSEFPVEISLSPDRMNSTSLWPSCERSAIKTKPLAGEDDYFVPVEQVKQFENSLTQARSVTSVVYDRGPGGAEHCQLGAVTLWHAAFFDWLTRKFPPHV